MVLSCVSSFILYTNASSVDFSKCFKNDITVNTMMNGEEHGRGYSKNWEVVDLEMMGRGCNFK